MRSSRPWSLLLGVAGALDCSMALYHLVLPYQMGWRQGLGGVPDSLVWALFALNYSWSVLLCVVGGLVLHAAMLGPTAGTYARRTVFAVGLFWVLHGAYTWVTPLPLPASLAWLRYVLGAFPAVVVIFHWLPLAVYRRLPLQEPPAP